MRGVLTFTVNRARGNQERHAGWSPTQSFLPILRPALTETTFVDKVNDMVFWDLERPCCCHVLCHVSTMLFGNSS